MRAGLRVLGTGVGLPPARMLHRHFMGVQAPLRFLLFLHIERVAMPKIKASLGSPGCPVPLTASRSLAM